jgi:U3 small nucleolar RNA-associated protein 14
MTDNNKLWFVVETEEVEETTKVTGERSGDDVGGGFGESELVETVKTIAKRQRVSLDAQALKSQMSSMLAMMDEVFSEANTRPGLQLDEVTLSVEINAEGKVSIVGNGGSLRNSGGMTLKFTRPK